MNWQNNKLSIVAALFLVAVLTYSNTFLGSFHFDDSSSITINFAIKNFRDLKSIWSFWPTRFLTYLTIALNYRFWGLNVLGYHIFNFILHLGCAVLVWCLMMLTFRTPSIKKEGIIPYAMPISLFVSCVFLLHPIQTQAVNYIIQRSTLLAAFFYVATLCLYVRARLQQTENRGQHIHKLYYSGACLTAVICMFCKEMAISLPFAICVYEFCFFRKDKGFNLKYSIPFFIIVLIIPITMLVTNSVDFKEMHRVTEDSPGISIGNYFMNEFRVMVTYMRLLFLPVNQNLDYNYPVAKTIFQAPIIFSFLLLFCILMAAAMLLNRYRLISFGIFWFFITLLPESGFIPIKDLIFEHRLYLPAMGFALFLVSGLYYLSKGRRQKFITAMLILLSISYSIMTYNRNKVWQNELTLWNDAVRKSSGKARAYKYRGLAYMQAKEYDLALSDFSKVLQLEPNNAEPYNNRGVIYMERKKYAQAMSDFNQSIRINPNGAEAYNNRGLIFFEQKDYSKAISDFKKALSVDKNSPEAYYNLGRAYIYTGRNQEAIQLFEELLKMDPRSSEGYNNIAIIYGSMGAHEKVIELCQKAIRFNPKYSTAYMNLGSAYGALGDYEKAIYYLKKAISINPLIACAYSNLAAAYYFKNEYALAIKNCDYAIKLGCKVGPDFLELLKPHRK
jgi:tetratricopeptide (TPR) repeat protein